ncbi:MAG TPA: TIGR01777 family oxidoreductase [Pseudonocardiaceae bacterium]|nr:TIGR01777 family oxidoreductase [Pseudonocardiaceae bacterium]
MRIVLAGSSGLIGSALAPELSRAGHTVLRLVRRAPQAADERRWDPPAGRIEPGALDGADAVINLCGAGIGDARWTEARKQQLRDSRETPTEVLAAAVAEHRIPVLVNASAVAFYGDTGDRAVDETAPAGDTFLARLCRDWEAGTVAATAAGARVALLRTGLVLAGRGGLFGRLRPLFAAGLGGRLGGGAQFWPWISLADVLSAIRYVTEHATLSGPVNLTGPAPVTNAEFTRTLGELMRRPAPWAVPGFALKPVFGIQLVDELMLISQRVLPKVLLRDGFAFAHSSLRDALAAALAR